MDMFTNGIEVSVIPDISFIAKLEYTALQCWKIKSEKDLNQGDDIMTSYPVQVIISYQASLY